MDRARTQHDVSEKLLVSHLSVADGNTQAENFLELELDSAAYIQNLCSKVIGVRDWRRELAS